MESEKVGFGRDPPQGADEKALHSPVDVLGGWEFKLRSMGIRGLFFVGGFILARFSGVTPGAARGSIVPDSP